MTSRQLLIAAPADDPINQLNTTPLIDVMLVLLIMFIVTIPISAHQVPVDLPQGQPTQLDPVLHRLELGAGGALELNGRPVSDAALGPALRAIAVEPNASLALRVEGEARYERFDQVLAAVKSAGVTRLGMVGNEGFAAALR
jgi:biopolymer transport protein ExbD